jgi:NADH:ubiquinone oxidoreductase subunit 3 (subunit A)
MFGLLLPLAATAHHRSTTPYVLGAVVIAVLAVALVWQLKRGVKRQRRR